MRVESEIKPKSKVTNIAPDLKGGWFMKASTTAFAYIFAT